PGVRLDGARALLAGTPHHRARLLDLVRDAAAALGGSDLPVGPCTAHGRPAGARAALPVARRSAGRERPRSVRGRPGGGLITLALWRRLPEETGDRAPGP